MTDQIDPETSDATSEESVKRPRGIYLLPNLFTTGALFSGFYAVISGMNGHFTAAAVAIFVAMIFDGLDGRVARMTNTQSKFGAEYDSLSDMVSFGVAPALVSFTWVLQSLGKFGWVAAFIYCACAALRLARFNTQIGSLDKRYFMGLPSPAAAATIAGLIWFMTEKGIDPAPFAWLIALYVALIGLSMVSNVLYNSGKEINLKGKITFVKMIVIVLVVAFLATDPDLYLWLIFLAYTVSGPIQWLLRSRKRQAD